MNKELTFLNKERAPASPSHLMALQPASRAAQALNFSSKNGGIAQLEEVCSERTSYSDRAEHVQSTAILNQQHVFLLLADMSVLALSRERFSNVQTFI